MGTFGTFARYVGLQLEYRDCEDDEDDSLLSTRNFRRVAA